MRLTASRRRSSRTTRRMPAFRASGASRTGRRRALRTPKRATPPLPPRAALGTLRCRSPRSAFAAKPVCGTPTAIRRTGSSFTTPERRAYRSTAGISPTIRRSRTLADSGHYARAGRVLHHFRLRQKPDAGRAAHGLCPLRGRERDFDNADRQHRRPRGAHADRAGRLTRAHRLRLARMRFPHAGEGQRVRGESYGRDQTPRDQIHHLPAGGGAFEIPAARPAPTRPACPNRRQLLYPQSLF